MTWPTALTIRAQPAVPFLAIGGACVIAGGLAAAVTAHAPSENATWAVAYLVLVAGVAQAALGAGQAWLADQRPPPPLLVVELATWNLGNAAVIAGTISGMTPVVDIGGALLIIALALLLVAVRSPRRTGWPLILYRTLIVIVGVSIPVGLVLAELKPR
ncbi:MAG: hypothetical protein ACRDN0_12240 [Trebonia sp.]